MFLNIRLSVPETLPYLSQKAGNFCEGRLKILRAGRLWGGFTCIPNAIDELISSTVAVNSIHMLVQKGNDLLMPLMYQTKILPLCKMCNV